MHTMEPDKKHDKKSSAYREQWHARDLIASPATAAQRLMDL
jgi:hypothetical protein